MDNLNRTTHDAHLPILSFVRSIRDLRKTRFSATKVDIDVDMSKRVSVITL